MTYFEDKESQLPMWLKQREGRAHGRWRRVESCFTMLGVWALAPHTSPPALRLNPVLTPNPSIICPTPNTACWPVVYSRKGTGVHQLSASPHRLTKSMETMALAVEFLGWVRIMMEAGMSRVKLFGSKLTVGGSTARTCTMKGWDKM